MRRCRTRWLGRGEAVQPADVLLEPVAGVSSSRRGCAEDVGLELVDLVLQRLDHRVIRVGQPVEDPVDEHLLVVRGLLRERLVQVVKRHAVVVADRGDEVPADVDVDLDRLRRTFAV